VSSPRPASCAARTARSRGCCTRPSGALDTLLSRVRMVHFSRFRLAAAPVLLAALVVGVSACYGEGDEPVAADTARYAATEGAPPVPPPPPAPARPLLARDQGHPG